MFKCDILEERRKRQRYNEEEVEKLLRANLLTQQLKRSIYVNNFEVDRCLEADLSFNNLDENTIGFVAKLISVLSTRQGSKDELRIVNGVNDALIGMSLEKPEKEIRIEGIDKSIDAVLKNHNGAVIGHVFCKVVAGIGGQQDNVKGEALRFLKHASKQDDDLLQVCLVDGNYKWRKKAKQYLSKDIWLCDHQQFQEKLQKRYGVELKEIDETNPVKNPLEELMYADAA